MKSSTNCRGVDSHQTVLAHAVAGEDLPVRLVVAEAAQTRRGVEVLAARGVAVGDSLHPVFALLAPAQATS